MAKQLIASIVSFCIILCSLPLESATPLNTPAEQAKVISNSFFDGSTPLAAEGSPGLRPSLALVDASPLKAPLLIAHNNPALDQACRGIGKGPDCVAHIKPQAPKKPDPLPDREGATATTACDPSLERCPAKTSGWSRLLSQAKANAARFPSSEEEALEQFGKSFAALSIGLLSFFLIIGIPFLAVGFVALASSLIYFTGSMLYGGLEAFIEIFSFGKHKPNQDTLKKNPLRLAFYWVAKTALFLALLPISLPVVIYQRFNDPRRKVKRLKNKQEELSQERDDLQDKKEQLQMKLEKLYQGEIKKPKKTTGEDELPDVVHIDVPPYENPAEGMPSPPKWAEDLKPKPPPPSPEEQIQTLDEENASLNKDIQDLKSQIQLLEKRITEEYRQGHVLYRQDYLESHGVAQKDTETNDAITQEIKKNLGNNFWQNPQIANSLTPENRELIKGLDLRFEVAKGPYNKNGKPLLGVLHDTAKNKSEPASTITLQEPPFIIPSASLRVVKSPKGNLRKQGVKNNNGETHGGADIECDWGPKNDGYGVPVGLRHKTQAVYTYREVGTEAIKGPGGEPLKNNNGKEIKVDKGFGNTVFLLDLDRLKTNPNQRVFWILAHEGEYNKPLPTENGEPRFSGILANRGETIEAYHPIILLGRSGNAIKAGKRGAPVPQVHIEKIVVDDPGDIKELDALIKRATKSGKEDDWKLVGNTLKKPTFRRPYRRDPLEGYK